RLGRDAALLSAVALDPGDLGLEPQHLPEDVENADEERTEDYPVERRISHERAIERAGDEAARQHDRRQKGDHAVDEARWARQRRASQTSGRSSPPSPGATRVRTSMRLVRTACWTRRCRAARARERERRGAGLWFSSAA